MESEAKDVIVEPVPGKRLSLTEQLAEFSEFVAGLVAPKLASHWRERLAARWEAEQATFADKTDNTKKLYGSKFRKAAKDAVEGHIDFAGGRTGDDLVTPEQKEQAALTRAILDMPEKRREMVLEALPLLLATPKDILDRVYTGYREKVAKRHSTLAVVGDWEKLAVTFRMMLRSDDPNEKALGIIGCTGRRFREVLQTGTFGLVREGVGAYRVTQRFALTFHGQLKTRGAKGTQHEQTYSIPVLAPAKEVLAAINSLRSSPQGKEWAGLSPRTLNSRVNQSMNRYLAVHPKIVGLWPSEHDLTIKSLRNFYAEVAYLKFAPATISKSAYFGKVLGHSEHDIETSQSYMTLALSGHEDAARAAFETTAEALAIYKSERKLAGLPVKAVTLDDDDDDDDEGEDRADPAPEAATVAADALEDDEVIEAD